MAAVSSFGKRGELRMRFERDGAGRSILREMYRRAPVIVQQALYFDVSCRSFPASIFFRLEALWLRVMSTTMR